MVGRKIFSEKKIFFFLVQINREQIKDFVPEKMLNEHYGSSSFFHQHDSHNLIDEQMINNISFLNYEWQTLLSYDHWPTLFSYYNISYDNRYLTIMPSIYLPFISPEDQQFDKTTKTSSYKVNILCVEFIRKTSK
jgi:hypothetical protein